jgi:hypothetical protein
MRIARFILTLLLMPLISFGQDTTLVVANRYQFSIQAGGFYKTFLGSKYIEPSTYNYGDDFTKYQYERYNKIQTFGFSTGLLITFKLSKHWGLTTGLIYSRKKDVFEINQDTVIKYGSPINNRVIQNAIKYDYAYNNIEIPVMLEYPMKNLTFYAGCYFSLLTYKKTEYTYVVFQYSNNPQWIIANKTIEGFELPFKLFPTIQASYDLKIKNRNINPYFALYYALANQNDLYLQFGINIPLIKTKN